MFSHWQELAADRKTEVRRSEAPVAPRLPLLQGPSQLQEMLHLPVVWIPLDGASLYGMPSWALGHPRSLLGLCSKISAYLISRVRLFAASWTVACQAPLSMGFFRQQYWCRLPFPSLGDLPDPGIEPYLPRLLQWQADPLPLGHLERPRIGSSCLVAANLRGDSLSSLFLCSSCTL